MGAGRDAGAEVKASEPPADARLVRHLLRGLADDRVRLALLLVVLAGLLAYGVTSGAGTLGFGRGSADAGPNGCPSSLAPSVTTIARRRLVRLRKGLSRIVRGTGPSLYEQGLADSGFAWTDAEPGMSRSLPPEPRLRGGYEMRWWLANGDDLGADVFVFADRRRAIEFVGRATSAKCRSQAAAFPAAYPPGGRNLVWRNPDGFGQEDLFLSRGRRVYRVVVVAPGSAGSITASTRELGFALVNGLGCALPGAACGPRFGHPPQPA